MKRELARRWAKALESGDYKQGFGQLRKNGRFCCLAVLCNLHAQDHPEIAAQQKKAQSYCGNSGVLPIEVMKWSGVKDDCGDFGSNSLSGLNDEHKLTFPEIAKVIRKHYKEL